MFWVSWGSIIFSTAQIVKVVLKFSHAGRLLEDAQSEPYYQSWFSKVQAALQHCCGRALREELELQSRLVSVLVQVAEKVRAADKARRKVPGSSHLIMTFTQSLRLTDSVVRSVCFSLQNVLKKEKAKITEFFRGGVSCCLALDPAVRVKALDVEVRTSHSFLISFYSAKAFPRYHLTNDSVWYIIWIESKSQNQFQYVIFLFLKSIANPASFGKDNYKKSLQSNTTRYKRGSSKESWRM